MRSSIIAAGLLIAALFGAVFAYAAEQDLSALIKTLQEQIQTLQKQLETLRSQPPIAAEISASPFTTTLRRGSRHSEVKRLQEFLKAMPEFYPEGLVTGYFGALTEQGVRRFQKANGIDAIGIVGPKTRLKLNELLAAKTTPTEPIPPAPVPEPPTITITPAPEPAPATTTPPAPATTTPALITPPIVLPTQAQLGMPIISFFGWSRNSLKLQFTHEPGNYTRSYTIYLRYPDTAGKIKSGPHPIIPTGLSSTAADGGVFKRTGPTSWEWIKNFDFDSEPDGTYQAAITAVGDGGIESAESPERIGTLYSKAIFEDLYEGAPLRAVQNLKVTRFPLTIRIANFHSNIYYYYTIYDGDTRIWDSAYLITTTSLRAEAVFQNSGNYPFAKDKIYRLRADTFDNNVGGDSAIKQKPNEMTFTYSP